MLPSSSTVRTAYLAIKAGEADFGLAVGAEQMGKMGLLAGKYGALAVCIDLFAYVGWLRIPKGFESGVVLV